MSRRTPVPDLTPPSPDELAAALAYPDEAETAALLAEAVPTPPEPLPVWRYTGGCPRVPPEYDGQLCAIVEPAPRRKASRRILFRDGAVCVVKARWLKAL